MWKGYLGKQRFLELICNLIHPYLTFPVLVLSSSFFPTLIKASGTTFDEKKSSLIVLCPPCPRLLISLLFWQGALPKIGQFSLESRESQKDPSKVSFGVQIHFLCVLKRLFYCLINMKVTSLVSPDSECASTKGALIMISCCLINDVKYLVEAD